MMQRRSSNPFVDHLLALATAVALPLLALIWLLQPTSTLPLHESSEAGRDALSVQWIRSAREVMAPAPPESRTTAAIADEASELPVTTTEPTEPAATTTPATTTGVASEAPVGLPVESGGSIYDPSKTQAYVVAASDRLRSVALTSEDSPARVDPLSLAEHAPLLPSSFDSAGRSGAKVEVIVDPNGIAIEVNVTEGSGGPALDAAILDAARTWSYEPARAEGVAVTSRLELEVTLERGVDSDGSVMPD